MINWLLNEVYLMTGDNDLNKESHWPVSLDNIIEFKLLTAL